MIVCDSNVLVALVDHRDPLHEQAHVDLVRMIRWPLMLTEPALVESFYLLRLPFHRRRLREMIARFEIAPAPEVEAAAFYEKVFTWTERYDDQDPNWADAHLAVLSSLHRELRIWTYDSEFVDVWRRLDGTRIPLAKTSGRPT